MDLGGNTNKQMWVYKLTISFSNGDCSAGRLKDDYRVTRGQTKVEELCPLHFTVIVDNNWMADGLLWGLRRFKGEKLIQGIVVILIN